MSLKPKFTVTQADVRLSAAHPVRVQRALTRKVAPHGHDYHEIAFVREGSATHLTAEGRAPLRRGCVLVVPPGLVHGFESQHTFVLINVYYLAEWLLAELSPRNDREGLAPLFLGSSLFPCSPRGPILQIELDAAGMSDCLRELEGIAAELDQTTPSRLYLKAMFLKCLVLLGRAMASQPGRPRGPAHRPEVRMVLDGIEQALDNSQMFHVGDVARPLGFSAAYITRLFKHDTGSNPQQHFQFRRIQRACAQLLHPRPSVTDIAHALGFADAAHFSRMFRRFQNCSPRAWRRRHAAT
ncbi:MAG: helix-turn-helix domain-containing protein [Phycisphaeraceae bacterium]|nr:helix-turn-helix domain-containing protein [Phycisphaeraceae bacterium]